MMTTPHGKAGRVDKSSAGSKSEATPGFGMSAPSPTYDGITYVIETERIGKTPTPPTPDGSSA